MRRAFFRKYLAANEAEMLAGGLKQHGVTVDMLIQPDGVPRLAFEPNLLPAPARISEVEALIRARFAADLQFRKDLFGWLLVEGNVFQRFAERQPEFVRLEDAPS